MRYRSVLLRLSMYYHNLYIIIVVQDTRHPPPLSAAVLWAYITHGNNGYYAPGPPTRRRRRRYSIRISKTPTSRINHQVYDTRIYYNIMIFTRNAMIYATIASTSRISWDFGRGNCEQLKKRCASVKLQTWQTALPRCGGAETADICFYFSRFRYMYTTTITSHDKFWLCTCCVAILQTRGSRRPINTSPLR